MAYRQPAHGAITLERHPYNWYFRGLLNAIAVLAAMSSGRAQAPSHPAVETINRARVACDSAASRANYRVIRRGSGSESDGAYQLPLHVAHSGTEVDLTCRYDLTTNGTELLPSNEGESHRERAGHDVPAALTRTQFEVQQECKNSINSRPGYQTTWVGRPVLREKHAWDVPVTVRRDGEVDQRATCRFDSSTGRVTLRAR